MDHLRSVSAALDSETSEDPSKIARVFGYCRASTNKQVGSPDTQKGLIAKYAEFNGLTQGEPIRFYVDAATSGKIPLDKRAAGREMMSDIRRGDHVIIVRPDRAFRRLADCVAVLDRFVRMGVKLHICDFMGGAIDLLSPMGMFLMQILGAFAELERAFISERTKEGLARRKKVGIAHSRYAGYGYHHEKRWINGKLVKVKVRNDAERAVMARIVEYRIKYSQSWDQIRQELNYGENPAPTKDGHEWDNNRVRRAFTVEMQLQAQEQGVRPARKSI
jgi:DNA invertase Pin-like site-specific DNA recombinase